MSQYDLMLYLKLKLCHCGLYFMVHDFSLYLEGFLMYKHDTLG